MRWLICLFLFAVLLACGPRAEAAAAGIVKVLPHLVDQEGRHSLSPSLYDRDAYQAQLRAHPELRAGLRFDVQWKGAKTEIYKLRLELRGQKDGVTQTRILERPVKKAGLLGNWAALTLSGADYQKFGDLLAWRATLWQGDQQVGEQKSFLW